MDEIKDVQKSDSTSRFFDAHPVRTNPFGINQSADRLYRRAERIVAALHLITNHIPASEALRISVRAEGLHMLENVLSLRDEMRVPDSAHSISCRVSIRHVISLVRMLGASGFLSTQNTHTVVEGLDELGVLLDASANSALSESVSLVRENFRDPTSATVKDVKDIRGIKDRIPLKDIKVMSNTIQQSAGLSVREGGIVEILRANGELGIRDIASSLPEYSEKMIQRDLMRLVTIGYVKKTGLKRWSRYSVAQ